MTLESFVPRGQEGLLLRHPTTQVYTTPAYHNKSLLYSRNIRPTLSREEARLLDEEGVPERMGFFTRHNPHPVRVRHMKGLLDAPICMVEDNLERRILWSAPSSENFHVQYRPPGCTRYSANTREAAVGIVPITYAWRDELERKTHNAISRALGQTPTLPSQQGQRSKKFESLEDDQLLDLLCRILQTESIPTCQAWLSTATDTEKTIVLNMLRMAATGEIDPSPVMKPKYEQGGEVPPMNDNSLGHPLPPVDEAKSHSLPIAKDWDMEDNGGNLPFKMPQHDTIIRSTHSRLSSRGRDRSFHERLQNEIDQQVDTMKLRPASHQRQRSSSFSEHPVQTNLTKRPGSSRRSHRPRSNSIGSCRIQHDPNLPPPPISISVSRERINQGNSYWNTVHQ